jgi:molybdopterin-biosynthesis enzyme MoeA-like protein
LDDLTAEAVSKAFDFPLELDSDALDQIESYFARRNRVMAESNRKQAYFPKGAIRLDNALGSAPGFALKKNQCWFVFLPGVPSEMYHIFNELVREQLKQRFVLQASKLIAIKSIGIGESDLQNKLDDCVLPDYVQLGFRATTDEVQTKLLFSTDATKRQINDCVDVVVNKIGDPVYAVDDLNKSTTDLASVISLLMQDKNYTLWVMETASQGLISEKIIGQDWLLGSSYTQSIDATLAQLSIVKQVKIEETAKVIANKLKETQGADLILVQLYQGDKEQFLNKAQSIILYNTLLTPQGIFQQTLTTTGPIKRKQSQAAIKALDLLRRYLQNKCH